MPGGNRRILGFGLLGRKGIYPPPVGGRAKSVQESGPGPAAGTRRSPTWSRYPPVRFIARLCACLNIYMVYYQPRSLAGAESGRPVWMGGGAPPWTAQLFGRPRLRRGAQDLSAAVNRTLRVPSLRCSGATLTPLQELDLSSPGPLVRQGPAPWAAGKATAGLAPKRILRAVAASKGETGDSDS